MPVSEKMERFGIKIYSLLSLDINFVKIDKQLGILTIFGGETACL